MLVLHAGLMDGRFYVWGEAPADATRAPRARRKRTASAAPLPFAADGLLLATALVPHLPSLVRDATAKALFLWLPTVAGQPLASNPLIAPPPPEADSPAAPAPWGVTAWPLSPAQTVALLATCLDREALAPGVLVGRTLAYWVAALRFAAALVAREQFLPGVERGADGWRACWAPALHGNDEPLFTRLARAMPGAARALGRPAAPPDAAAATVLSAFLALALDELVRSSAAPPAPRLRRPSATRKAPAFDSIHDQWLHALRSADGRLTGTDGELSQLAEQVRAWQRPVAVVAAAPFRLTFRLEEPPANGDGGGAARVDAGWTVRYLLQAKDDPSLLLPADEAWAPRGERAALLRRGGFHPREYLLAALGQAAALSPPVEASLKWPAPGGFALDATGAHAFLTETAWLLEQAGFGVLLPAWWTRKGTKQRLSVSAHVKSPPTQGGGGLTLEDLVQFEWRVAVGDHTLTLDELQALARLKAPLVKVRGQWVQMSADEIQAALAFWKGRKAGTATVRDLLRMHLGAAPAPGGMPFTGVTGAGCTADLLRRLEGNAAFEELPPPAGFRGELRPYQVRGYSWLAFLRRWGLGACLADDMGLGKTVQMLALLERARQEGATRPALLVCPTSVVGNWMREAARFTPDLPVLLHHGPRRLKGAAFAKGAKRHALVVTSYALLHRDLALLGKPRWDCVILDEAQNIKNPETKQAKAACALAADARVALTGTPVENHVGDLWSISQFLNPGFLGGKAEFRRAFFMPIQVQRDADAAKRLQRLTGPFLLRRVKTDKSVIADLPEKVEMKEFCTLTKEQASLYAAVVGELEGSLDDAGGIQRKGLILGALSKLKQVCNHPAHFLGDNSPVPGRSGKLARPTELLDEVLQEGDRALIFTQFTEMGDILKRHLEETFGREVLYLHGGLPRKRRDEMVARFQSAGDAPPLFLLSLKAGGTGVTLTAASHVFHFDRWWNPAVENQATDRAFRIGQRRNVVVHKFVCSGTLEEKIDEMIGRKQSVAARVVGAGEAWLTELSNRELKDLLTLRQEALEE
jgi:superfamily II DNA or RNA helicase